MRSPESCCSPAVTASNEALVLLAVQVLVGVVDDMVQGPGHLPDLDTDLVWGPGSKLRHIFVVAL